MGKLKGLVALFLVAVAGSSHAGVKRDVPLLYQTLGTKNTPLALPGTGHGLKGAAFDGLRVWVGDYTMGKVYGIDIYSNQVVSEVTLQSGYVAGIAFDGTSVWALARPAVLGGGYAYKFDPNNPPTKTLAPTVTDPSLAMAWGAAFDGRYLWTTGTDYAAVAIDLIANPPIVATTVSPINLGSGAVVFDGHFVWMASPLGLIKIDATTRAVVFSTTAITGQGGVNAFATDGAYLWLLDRPGNSVQQINPQTNNVVATIAVPDPQGIAFDGSFVWVGQGQGGVTRIDVRNATIAESYSFSTGFYPYNVLYDGTHAWIIDGGGSVSKILVRGN